MFLTIEELSQVLKIKVSKLRSMVFKREIPYVKLGRLIRFKKDDIEKFVALNTKEQGKN